MNTSEDAMKIAMIHGMYGSSGMWEEHRKAFEDQGFEVCALDLPLHTPPGDAAGVAQMGLRDYRLFLEKELADDAASTVLVGHSMGGLLAQILASRHPFKAAVLVTPAPPAEVPVLDPRAWVTFFPFLLLGDLRKKALIPRKKFFKRLFSENMSPEREEEIFSFTVPESGRAFMEMAFPFFSRKPASFVPRGKIQCPLLVLAGGRDKVIPPFVVKMISRRYPQAEYLFYPDLAHGMLWEPGGEKVIRDMIDWLQKIG